MADKKALAAYFNRHPTHWVSMAELQHAFPEAPARTLRNWLTALVRDGTIERTGEKKGARYRCLRESGDASALANATASPPLAAPRQIFSQVATRLLQKVEQPLYTRSPVTYNDDWVKRYDPNHTFYLTETQRAQLHQLGKRPPIQGRAGTYIQKIYNRLLIDLSYNSSRLEGNTYSLADTERLVIKGIGAAGKLKEEQVMILNHKEAIRYLAHNAPQLSLDQETIRTLHYLLSDGLVAPELAGQLRDDGVLISGTTYTPLEGRERLAERLDTLLEQARRIRDPFEQSVFLLGHLSYLQAFVDVNKRVGRLASIIPLIANDYVPQSFVDADKNDYTRALICFYELNEVQPLAELYFWSYLRTCEHYDTSVHVMGFDELAVLYRPQRRALIGEIVRSRVAVRDVPAYLAEHMPPEVKRADHEKFEQDLLGDLERLDVTRLPGLGVDKNELQTWLELNNRGQPRG